MNDIDEMLSWLRGVLDAEECKAQTAASAVDLDGIPGDHWTYDGSVAQIVDEQGRIVLAGGSYGGTWLDDARGEHIARQDPAHELAIVAAHRAIIGVVMSRKHFYLDEDAYYSCAQAVDPYEPDAEPGSGCIDGDRAGKPCDCGLDRRRRAILALLAAGYAGRDGYREEWRPA